MARRNLDTLSTASLLGATEDAIPKEYHRKVLKKIAQLTKVIYVLNTKNDEHEEVLAKLKGIYKEETDRILADCAQKLADCKQKLAGDNEAAKLRIQTTNNQLTLVQAEKDSLMKEQVSYKQAMEQKFADAKSQHSNRIAEIENEVKTLQLEQKDQLMQVGQLQEKWSTQLQNELKVAKEGHEIEKNILIDQLKLQSKKEMEYIKEKYQRELELLRLELTSALEQQQTQMASTHQLQMEAKSRETEEKLHKKLTDQEEFLTGQISSLAQDLRKTQDNLALSEQKVVELLAQLELAKNEKINMQALLNRKDMRVEDIESQLRQIKNDLEISQDLYQKQKEEMDNMSNTIGICHAQQVIDEGTIQKLQQQISKFEDTIKELEHDNNILKSSQLSTSEQLSAKIYSLGKELEMAKIEKKELKLQYAREIEAAQAQLGEREVQLLSDNATAIQKLQKEMDQALADAIAKHEQNLLATIRQMEEDKEKSLHQLEEKWRSDNDHLSMLLTDHLMELNLVRDEKNRLQSELNAREKGLGSISDILSEVKEELVNTKRTLAYTEKEKNELDGENCRLTASLEDLKSRFTQEARSHQDQLKELRRSLSDELEEVWKNKLKKECGLLMKELSSRHEEDSKAALLELASQKDKAMETAMHEWEADKRKLIENIMNLQQMLDKAKESNAVALDEAKESAEKRLSDLRLELNKNSEQNSDTIQQLKQSQAQELECLQKELDGRREAAMAKMEERHNKELQEQWQASQVSVKMLQEKMSMEKEDGLQDSKQRHLMEMALLRKQYLAEKDEALSKKTEKHRNEVERLKQHSDETATALNDEISRNQALIASLNSEKELQAKELNKLHAKVSTLNVSANSLQKKLDLKNQECVMIQREANVKLQQHKRDLKAEHRAEQESLKCQYMDMRQKLYDDYKAATDQLNCKIKQLKKEIHDWELKYASRDSKPEDLDQIRQLRESTERQKMKIKDLIAEKKLYQLELTNREKNYNQIFSATPNVGILNPLAHKKQPSGQYQSAPSLFLGSESQQHHHPAAPPPLLSNHSLPELPRRSSLNSHQQLPTVATGTDARHRLLKRDSPLAQHRTPADISFSGKGGREKGFQNGSRSTAATSLPHLHSVSLASQ